MKHNKNWSCIVDRMDLAPNDTTYKRELSQRSKNFIDKNKILYKYQFGFRKLHSTNHAIISLVEKVNNALESGKILIGVFFTSKKRLTPLTIAS